jgi:hypothetical protein
MQLPKYLQKNIIYLHCVDKKKNKNVPTKLELKDECSNCN